jgi:hypothetical protein
LCGVYWEREIQYMSNIWEREIQYMSNILCGVYWEREIQYMSNILCGVYWEREIQYIYNPVLMKIEYRLIIWLTTAFPRLFKYRNIRIIT